MNKIKLSLSLFFLTNFVCMHPFLNRYKKPLFLGGITSLAGRDVYLERKKLKGILPLPPQRGGHQYKLLYGNALRQVPWLVHVASAHHGNVVGE